MANDEFQFGQYDNITLIPNRDEISEKWNAEQMLENLLADVKAGKIKPEKMIILLWEPTLEDRLRLASRRVNFRNGEYIAFLTRAAHDALHEWRGD